MSNEERYRLALLDWLACAAGGAGERAAQAAAAAGEGLLERVAAAGTAGHVLDYDDTYSPGVIHASAAAAPAALVLGAELGKGVGEVVAAYAAGFEAAAGLAAATHPALYDGGWHPTAVCGSFGAATAAAVLLALDAEQANHASALAVLRAGGVRAAFGSDGKALQVGMAAAAGVHAARIAAAGAVIPIDEALGGPAGFARAFGVGLGPRPQTAAIGENWIKPWPCCLATHSTIEAVATLRERGIGAGETIAVTVHPLARQAAALDDVGDGLEAKFSIPYLAAYTLLHGPPRLASFAGVDEEAKACARRAVTIRTDATLGEWEARVQCGGEAVAVEWAIGSPQRPLDSDRHRAKLAELAGARLDGALDDADRPARELLNLIGAA